MAFDRSPGIRIKFKSPAYLRVHRMRGNGIPSLKNIIEVVIHNEQHEYLSIFPEDEKFFNPVVDKLAETWDDVLRLWDDVHHIENQKEFALAVKDNPYSAIFFIARKLGTHPRAWEMKDTYVKTLSRHLLNVLDEKEIYML